MRGFIRTVGTHVQHLMLGIAIGLVEVACASGPPPLGYPLYSNGGARRPPGQVASVYGPIESIDGQSVAQHGSAFELLPGCHLVALSSDVVESTNEIDIRGTAGTIVFALNMRPGHRYFLHRDVVQSAGGLTLSIGGKEEDSLGNVLGELGPARSRADIDACLAAASNP